MKKIELFKTSKNQTSSRRNDRVASQIRECISTALIRGDLYDMPCDTVTITHVDLSPDLRNAKIFIIPVGGTNTEKVISYFEKNKHYFKNIIATKMKMRFIPEIIFRTDDSFEYSNRIEKLLLIKKTQHCNKL